LILQKTWCDVWQTTIQRWDFGEVGTGVIIFGLSGEFWNSPIFMVSKLVFGICSWGWFLEFLSSELVSVSGKNLEHLSA